MFGQEYPTNHNITHLKPCRSCGQETVLKDKRSGCNFWADPSALRGALRATWQHINICQWSILLIYIGSIEKCSRCEFSVAHGCPDVLIHVLPWGEVVERQPEPSAIAPAGEVPNGSRSKQVPPKADFRHVHQWLGLRCLREKLPETPIFHGKINGFL